MDLVLSGLLAIGGASSSCAELWADLMWWCPMWLEVEEEIPWLFCSKRWESLSVGVLLGLLLLTRLKEEPIDDAV